MSHKKLGPMQLWIACGKLMESDSDCRAARPPAITELRGHWSEGPNLGLCKPPARVHHPS